MRRQLLQMGLMLAVFLALAFTGYQLKRGWRRGLQTLAGVVIVVVVAYGGYRVLRWWTARGGLSGGEIQSNMHIVDWLNDPRPELRTGDEHVCSEAPFILPSEGFIGLLWRDPAPPYSTGYRHTGIDIFGEGRPGTVPVRAVYDGWLTRQDDWKATVIIRHNDPLQLGRTIWTYYTHMASRDGRTDYIDDAYPPGTTNKFVEQGTVLGYQGEFAGTGSPIAMHVHMSIVGTGADGEFLNEGALANTIDPSPYFDLALNIDQKPARPIRCAK